MSKQPISIQASLEGISPRKDGSMGFRFVTTREITNADEMALIMGYYNTEGYMLFAPQDIQEKDIPKEQIESGQKSAGTRLRACIYRFWEQEGSQGDSEVFYRQQMEKIINLYKDKLN